MAKKKDNSPFQMVQCECMKVLESTGLICSCTEWFPLPAGKIKSLPVCPCCQQGKHKE